MIDIGAISILALILTLGSLEAVTVVNQHPDDEYIVEHEVLREDALVEAKKLEIYPGLLPGCKPCTNAEMTYCKNGNVISDHCLCDSPFNTRYSRVFPFVEHTCRLGPEEFQVQAGNCAEYTRLRDCCCHSYLASVGTIRSSEVVHKLIGRRSSGVVVLLYCNVEFKVAPLTPDAPPEPLPPLSPREILDPPSKRHSHAFTTQIRKLRTMFQTTLPTSQANQAELSEVRRYARIPSTF